MKWLFVHCLCVMIALATSGCSLFEPRDPQPPSQSGSSFVPPTSPDIVISNLQSSIAQKNAQNYIRCFSDPFRFVPSTEAAAQYPGVLNSWTRSQEYDYMVNLISRAIPNGVSSLLLTQTASIVTADSVIYNYDYVFTFQHTEASFPPMARGNLQFAIGVDNSNWSIYRWSDFKTTADISWSSFKGKFSN